MTKDAMTLLGCMYEMYKQKLKTESRENAKQLQEKELDEKCSAIFNIEDIPDLLDEIQENDYIYSDVCGGIYLQNSAIVLMENLPKNEFKEIADFISKFI